VTPLVSVMLPAYNQAAFVESAVLSAVEQDYPDLQVVVADDGSTDGTDEIVRDVARRYADRVTTIVGLPNVGVTLNCNRALQACRGELVAFHAGDDRWLPSKVARQVEWFAEDERRVLCGHDVEVFDSTTDRRLRLWSEVQVAPAGDDARLFVRDGHPWHPLSTMARRRVIPSRGYDARIPLASDWKFFVDCVANGGVFGQIPGVHARYRSWAGNRSKRRPQMWDDVLDTCDLVEQEYPWLAGAARVCRMKSAARPRRGVAVGRPGARRGRRPGARRALPATARPAARGAAARAGGCAADLGAASRARGRRPGERVVSPAATSRRPIARA
jgi:glycosyltransferase involved in cell wall biosynthesis